MFIYYACYNNNYSCSLNLLNVLIPTVAYKLKMKMWNNYNTYTNKIYTNQNGRDVKKMQGLCLID